MNTDKNKINLILQLLGKADTTICQAMTLLEQEVKNEER